MSNRNIRYQYFVEGLCEKKLIDELKKNQMVIAGNVSVLNVKQKDISDGRLRLLTRNTIVILVFDTDTKDLSILKRNMEKLKESHNIRDIGCVMQVGNLEDELKRATGVRDEKDIIGCKSNKDFKGAFITEKNLLSKLTKHGFKFEKFWVSTPSWEYKDFDNSGRLIKL